MPDKETIPMDDTDTLAPRLSVEEVVRVHELAEKDIRDGFALVARAEKALNDTFSSADWRTVRVCDRYERLDFAEPAETLKAIRRTIWQILVERLELRRFMSIAAWEKLDKELRDGKDVPELDQASVLAMATQFRSQLPEMLEASVREVYEWLRPRAGSPRAGYKTNDVVEVGPKVILTYAVERWASTWHVCRYTTQRLTALQNVFTALDGRGSVTKTHYSEIECAVRQIPASSTCAGETPYFRFRGYANRNLHIEFLRLDLLARFNAVAGGARLRP